MIKINVPGYMQSAVYRALHPSSPTGRQPSQPNMQCIKPPMTEAQREQIDAIKYFFKTFRGAGEYK